MSHCRDVGTAARGRSSTPCRSRITTSRTAPAARRHRRGLPRRDPPRVRLDASEPCTISFLIHRAVGADARRHPQRRTGDVARLNGSSRTRSARRRSSTRAAACTAHHVRRRSSARTSCDSTSRLAAARSAVACPCRRRRRERPVRPRRPSSPRRVGRSRTSCSWAATSSSKASRCSTPRAAAPGWPDPRQVLLRRRPRLGIGIRSRRPPSAPPITLNPALGALGVHTLTPVQRFTVDASQDIYMDVQGRKRGTPPFTTVDPPLSDYRVIIDAVTTTGNMDLFLRRGGEERSSGTSGGIKVRSTTSSTLRRTAAASSRTSCRPGPRLGAFGTGNVRATITYDFRALEHERPAHPAGPRRRGAEHHPDLGLAGHDVHPRLRLTEILAARVTSTW